MERVEFTTHSFIKQKARELIMEACNNNWNLELWHEQEVRKAKGLGKYYRIQAQTDQPSISFDPFKFQGHSREID